MQGTRKKQIRTLMIVLIAVIGLTIGFAAFTSSLNIKTRLSVNPNNGTFLVKFSNKSTELDESDVVPTKSSDIFTAYDGEIDNSGIPTISNLGGQFTQPGEVITYDFYTLNTGEYKAYLTDVIFNNVDGESTNKVCTSIDGTHQSEVDEACKSISIKVIMGIDTIINTRSLTGHALDKNEAEAVKVVITYAEGGVLPEVEFDVEFGTISMVYNSLEESDVNGGAVVSLEPNFPDACFTSFTAGSLDLYNPFKEECGPDVEIPTSLPVTTLTYEFNDAKCLVYIEKMLEIESSANASPEQLCNMYKQELMSSLDEGFSEVDSYFGLILEYGMMLDINYTVGNTPVTLTNIHSYAFEYDDEMNWYLQMLGVEATASKITSLVIPNGIEEIGDSAFKGNNLTSVTIPASVTDIEAHAFYDNSNLATVTIEGANRTSNIHFSYEIFGSNVNSVIINTPTNYLDNFANSTFPWNSGDTCYMSDNGNPTTSSCITINSN